MLGLIQFCLTSYPCTIFIIGWVQKIWEKGLSVHLWWYQLQLKWHHRNFTISAAAASRSFLSPPLRVSTKFSVKPGNKNRHRYRHQAKKWSPAWILSWPLGFLLTNCSLSKERVDPSDFSWLTAVSQGDLLSWLLGFPLTNGGLSKLKWWQTMVSQRKSEGSTWHH